MKRLYRVAQRELDRVSKLARAIREDYATNSSEHITAGNAYFAALAMLIRAASRGATIEIDENSKTIREVKRK